MDALSERLARLGEGATVQSTRGPAPVLAPLGSGIVRALIDAASAPGDAWLGRFDPAADAEQYGALGRTGSLAGLAMTGGIGGVARQAGEQVLGSGPVRGEVLAKLGTVPERGLPMDEASRMARARAMGYSDDVFWRGEASGNLPTEYRGGGFFSRDRDYAAGFAQKGGRAEPREFRLDLSKAFTLGKPMTAGEYGRLVESAMTQDPLLAKQLASQFDRTPEWMVGFGKANPGQVITDRAGSTLTHELVAKSRAPEDVFKGAGFNAIDSGRDVRNLDGFGVRSAQAAFDPEKAGRRGILLSLPPAAGGILGLASRPGPRSD